MANAFQTPRQARAQGTVKELDPALDPTVVEAVQAVAPTVVPVHRIEKADRVKPGESSQNDRVTVRLAGKRYDVWRPKFRDIALFNELGTLLKSGQFTQAGLDVKVGQMIDAFFDEGDVDVIAARLNDRSDRLDIAEIIEGLANLMNGHETFPTS